jgi:hypothetical protein
MAPQVIEKEFDTIKHFSPEERHNISSLNSLSGLYALYAGGFRVIEVKMVRNPIDLDQAYFWSDIWQADEQAVDEEFKKGKFKKFSNPQDAIAYLRE